MKKKPEFIVTTPKTWDKAKLSGKRLGSYCFRGQASKIWGLETSIERTLRSPAESIGLWDREKELLRRFKARAHHYIQSPPDDDDIEWLALIQDHGGPTRLLDFTDSFYVASFFALESGKNDAGDSGGGRTGY